MVNSKPTISLIWIGHVDHGKSTTLGHFLSLIGAVDERTMEKLRGEAIEHQMESWQWAYVLDTLPEEKERGITADIAFYPFETQKRKFMLIDSPGHRDFVKNMIRGASQADACVLVVSAVPNDLKSGLKIGGHQDPGGQTREHAILASVMGINQVIIAINKMDLVNYREDRFNQACDLIKKLIKEIQSPWAQKLDNINFIPISGITGANLTKLSSEMKWYKGYNLSEALDSLEGVKYERNMEMRFIGYDLNERHGFGTLLLGKVLCSSIKIGDKVVLQPLGKQSEIKEIWEQQEKKDSLEPGQHGSILLKSISKEELEEGIVLAPSNTKYKFTSIIRSRLLILEGTFVPGSSVVFHCGASYSTAEIKSIQKILSKNQKHKKLPREFEGRITIAFEGELVEVDIVLNSPVVVEKFSDYPELGRIVLRRSGQTIGVGVVHDLLEEE
ncbi:MAG: GTP-binding protein [Candidatus Hodarchaeales archaeon]|jgi:elongation factor 1-alpha